MKKRKNLVVGVALAMLVLVSSVALAGGAAKSTADTYDFQPVEQGGTSKLVRNSSGISFNFKTVGTGVFPGYTYTVWVVVFNEPGNCTPAEGGCSADDIFDTPGPPKTDVLYGGGNVAGNAGKIHISGHRAEGDSSGSVYQDIFGAPSSPGLIDPLGAEVHLVLRSHGPKVPENMPAQIDSFDGGCVVDLVPPAVAVAVGECVDTQFAIHVAP
jgi:hypothetical protein